MSGFIKGMVFGGAIASAALVGFAYGQQGQSDSVDGQLAAESCRVDVGFGRTTFGDQCRYDQVMVGIRDDYLLCADVEVDCP